MTYFRVDYSVYRSLGREDHFVCETNTYQDNEETFISSVKLFGAELFPNPEKYIIKLPPFVPEKNFLNYLYTIFPGSNIKEINNIEQGCFQTVWRTFVCFKELFENKTESPKQK